MDAGGAGQPSAGNVADWRVQRRQGRDGDDLGAGGSVGEQSLLVGLGVGGHSLGRMGLGLGGLGSGGAASVYCRKWRGRKGRLKVGRGEDRGGGGCRRVDARRRAIGRDVAFGRRAGIRRAETTAATRTAVIRLIIYGLAILTPHGFV